MTEYICKYCFKPVKVLDTVFWVHVNKKGHKSGGDPIVGCPYLLGRAEVIKKPSKNIPPFKPKDKGHKRLLEELE